MHGVLSLVLAGGEGKRLMPLTRERAKPSVHFGGRYRLVDFVLSNLVNSGFTQIKVLTQYKPTSLVRHLTSSWPAASALFDQFVEVAPAGMNIGPQWFRGTADAIWQNLDLLRDVHPDDVLIFGSDHVYKMDVSLMVKQHRETGADLTVAALPVTKAEAREFGVLHVDTVGRITAFVEKPKDPPTIPGRDDTSLVSMGNYVFRTRALVDELRRMTSNQGVDFGKDILATAHERLRVYAYDFNSQSVPGESEKTRGYWRDVGSLDAYFEASMDLVAPEPRLDLYNARWPIRGVQPPGGPARLVDEGGARATILGAGSQVAGNVERSVLFRNVKVRPQAIVRDAVVFPYAEIGRGARLTRCIVDKGVRIPDGFVAGEDRASDEKRGFTISEAGVVVITRADLGQVDAFDIAGP